MHRAIAVVVTALLAAGCASGPDGGGEPASGGDTRTEAEYLDDLQRLEEMEAAGLSPDEIDAALRRLEEMEASGMTDEEIAESLARLGQLEESGMTDDQIDDLLDAASGTDGAETGGGGGDDDGG